MRVRRADISDCKQLAKLMQDLGYETSLTGLKAQIEAYIRSDSSLVLVAVENHSKLCGAVSGHIIPLLHQAGNLGRITAMVVASQARGSGIGKTLVAQTEDWFESNRCIRFEVTSAEYRHGAHKFYESCGYVFEDRRFLKSNTA